MNNEFTTHFEKKLAWAQIELGFEVLGVSEKLVNYYEIHWFKRKNCKKKAFFFLESHSVPKQHTTDFWSQII